MLCPASTNPGECTNHASSSLILWDKETCTMGRYNDLSQRIRCMHLRASCRFAFGLSLCTSCFCTSNMEYCKYRQTRSFKLQKNVFFYAQTHSSPVPQWLSEQTGEQHSCEYVGPTKKTDKTLKVHRLEWAFMRCWDPLSCFLWFGSWVSEFGSHLIGTCRTGKKHQKAMTSCLQAAQRTLRPQCSELPAWCSPNQAQLDLSPKVLLLRTLFRSNFRISWKIQRLQILEWMEFCWGNHGICLTMAADFASATSMATSRAPAANARICRDGESWENTNPMALRYPRGEYTKTVGSIEKKEWE